MAKFLRNKKFATEELPQLYALYQQRVKYDNEIKELKQVILKGKDVILQDELKGMKRVLRRLGMRYCYVLVSFLELELVSVLVLVLELVLVVLFFVFGFGFRLRFWLRFWNWFSDSDSVLVLALVSISKVS
jgi:hypothetical protein